MYTQANNAATETNYTDASVLTPFCRSTLSGRRELRNSYFTTKLSKEANREFAAKNFSAGKALMKQAVEAGRR